MPLGLVGPAAAIPTAPLPPPSTALGPPVVAPGAVAPTLPTGMLAPPPPPDPTEMFGGSDPMEDPLLAMLLLMAPFLDENEPPPGPVWPGWYSPRDYPKPDLTKIVMLAEADYQAMQPLLERFYTDYRRIHLKSSARFSRDARAKDPFVSTTGNSEVNLIVSLVGGIKPVTQMMNTKDELKEDAQKCEDYADKVWDDAQHDYREATMGVMARDEAMSCATYGRVWWRATVNLEEPENPINVDLLDPATVFPTFDGPRGLARVTRKYRDRLCDVIGLHDPDNARGVREKIERAALANSQRYAIGIDGSAGPVKGLEDHRSVEVIEYWDRRWYAVVVNNVLIKIVAHNYSFVPFVGQLVPSGAPAFTVAGNDYADARGIVRRHNEVRPIADIGVSHLHYMKHTLNIIESVHTRGLMEILKSSNQPVILYQTREAATGATRQADTSEGAVNPAILGEEQYQVWPTEPKPHVFGPVLNQVARDLALGTMPLSSYGVNEQSNVSGHALENLEEAGRDKIAPIMMALELGRAAVTEMILRESADWLDFAGYEGNKGAVPVYRQKAAPGEAASFEMTPQTIRRVGTRCKVSMRHVRMETLGPLFNAGAQGLDAGFITAEEILELRGISDPVRYTHRWENEKLRREALDHPKFKEYMIYQMFLDSPNPVDQQYAQWWDENVLNAPVAPPPGPPPGAPPGVLPPTSTNGIDLAALGLQGAPTGGPQGPVGPRGIGLPPSPAAAAVA